METVSTTDLEAIAAARLPTEPGASLDALSRALVILGVAVSVTSLDRPSIERAIAHAMDAGASPGQVQEVIALVAGLGVHSLMVSQAAVLDAARQRGLMPPDGRFDAERQMLWDSKVGDDPFWDAFERYNPGFLKAMLLLSPDIFVAFFEFCAVPWKSGLVRAKVKELLAMACDATPAHRFAPGFAVHLNNALALGASRSEVLETLAIAQDAPRHIGTA